MRQAYLSDSGAAVEIRVRAIGDALLLTAKERRAAKGHSASIREEVEFPIPADSFGALWSMAHGDAVHKRRWRVPVPGAVAEVDVYEGQLAGLRVAEVEFADAAEAERFAPPDWFGEELTGQTGWSNRALAGRHGATVTGAGAQDTRC
ncbi:hypothetical protein [Streptomyces sp. NPDC046985]|uniref:CYTH domain-containing protein n=1 Tax=Streptomyces sp. NPDC046985 TaxID=3155377 RepID=UPI0033D7E757